MSARILSALGVSVLAWLAWSTPASAAVQPPQHCTTGSYSDSATQRTLSLIPDAPTSVLKVEVIPAVRDVPEVCRVTGVIAPSIGFELSMPTQGWNGKLLMQGCGAMCGVFYTEQSEEGLVRHYAVVSTDMGHRGAPANALYAFENLQNQIDFGFRSTHLVALTAKTLAELYYDNRPIERSYFNGCSTGGRQAMVEAERFPEDFDGIIAGAPPYNETGDLPLYALWGARANLDADGKPILDASKIPMIHKAVIDACDNLDGLKDGIIQDPRQCNWDPSVIQCKNGNAGGECLTAAEVGVVKKIYDGAKNSKGDRLYWGPARGSELYWTPGLINTGGAPGAGIGDIGSFTAQFLANAGFYYNPGPAYSGKDFDYDRDPQRLAMKEFIYNAENPDLRRFKATGHKLILYHGWDDQEIPPEATVDYYETATRVIGSEDATKSFFRAFMVPAMSHCRRGPGGDAIDWISYIEDWVEKGKAPDAVIAHHLVKEQSYNGLPRPRYPLDRSAYDRTRPVFAFPDVAKWSGKGDPADAGSWEKAPRRTP